MPIREVHSADGAAIVYRVTGPADARPLLQFAADHCPPNYSEHLSAKLELQRLDAMTAAPSRY